MLASLLIVFREVLEAGLIVGIVLAATRGLAGRGTWIAGGIVGGVAGAAMIAAFAGAISDALSGAGQEVFNASVLASRPSCSAGTISGWPGTVARWRGR